VRWRRHWYSPPHGEVLGEAVKYEVIRAPLLGDQKEKSWIIQGTSFEDSDPELRSGIIYRYKIFGYHKPNRLMTVAEEREAFGSGVHDDGFVPQEAGDAEGSVK
jgi:hypothetical protein